MELPIKKSGAMRHYPQDDALPLLTAREAAW